MVEQNDIYYRFQTWQKSSLGNCISAVAIAQVLDHPTQVSVMFILLWSLFICAYVLVPR